MNTLYFFDFDFFIFHFLTLKLGELDRLKFIKNGKNHKAPIFHLCQNWSSDVDTFFFFFKYYYYYLYFYILR